LKDQATFGFDCDVIIIPSTCDTIEELKS